MDNNGFYQVKEKIRQLEYSHPDTCISGIDAINLKAPKKHCKKIKLVKKDVCFICDGWQMMEFKWIPGKSGESTDHVFIHLEFEDF